MYSHHLIQFYIFIIGFGGVGIAAAIFGYIKHIKD